MESLSPVLVVDAIEPCLPFWVERLGFSVTAEVPHGDALGFVILGRGQVTVMLQTAASVADDLPGVAGDAYRSLLYLQVDDLDDIAARVAGLELVVPRRTTFYGADELGVRDPAGNVVLFAHHDA